MSYIYHIITPEGTYIGQAKGNYVEPSWPVDTLKGNKIGPSRLWQHLNIAYTEKGKDPDKDKDNDGIAKLLRGYSPSQIKIKIFNAPNYGLKELSFESFKKSWVSNATRVAQDSSIQDVEEKLKKYNIAVQSQNVDQIKKSWDTIQTRDLTEEEKLDMAEIMHIYLFLTKESSGKLINISMGGQTTGWYNIEKERLGLLKHKDIYREMSPQLAKKMFDDYIIDSREIIDKLTQIINQAAKNTFHKQNFWVPIIDKILDDNLYDIFYSTVSRSDSIKKINEVFSKEIEVLKNKFFNDVTKIIQSNFPELQDIINNSDQLVIIDWDEIINWFTGYIYNIMGSTIRGTLEKAIGSTTNAKTQDKLRTKITINSAEANQLAKTILKNKNQAQQWKNTYYKISLLMGTGIKVDNLNKFFKFEQKQIPLWQTMKYSSGTDVSDTILKNYSMLLFDYFYRNYIKINNEYYDVKKEKHNYEDVITDTGEVLYTGAIPNNEHTIIRDIKKAYIRGGMYPSVKFLQDNEFYQSYNIMIKLAEQRRSNRMPILSEIRSTKGYTFVYNKNYIITNKQEADDKTIPKTIYLRYKIPTSIWSQIKGTYQTFSAINLENLKYY